MLGRVYINTIHCISGEDSITSSPAALGREVEEYLRMRKLVSKLSGNATHLTLFFHQWENFSSRYAVCAKADESLRDLRQLRRPRVHWGGKEMEREGRENEVCPNSLKEACFFMCVSEQEKVIN